MSLVRAFTTRRTKLEDLNIHVGRAASQRGGKPVVRAQISSPVALLSTTNSLSYDAPDIAGTRPIGHRNVSSTSSASSSHSAEDSDASTLSINTATDASSVDNSPVSPDPEPNHLSCYFKPAVDTSNRSSVLSGSAVSTDAPAIPQRVPSHSKRAHENVHRKRSVRRMMSPSRASTETLDPPAETLAENLFGNELAQLDEVQEDFSHAVRDAEQEADLAFMREHGYAAFAASDYLMEIHSLLYDVYLVEDTVWI